MRNMPGLKQEPYMDARRDYLQRVEFQLSAAVIAKKDFTWDVNFNASFNKVKVESLGTFQDFYYRNSGWGFSTITSMKIYRVTGKTAQKYGVTPDIVLPDLYDLAVPGESHEPGALPSDSVTKKTYYTPLPPLPLPELRNKSNIRVKASEAFNLTRECSNQFAASREKSDTVSLSWNVYQQGAERQAELFERLQESGSKTLKSFKIAAHAFSQQRLQMDEYARQQNDSWIEKLSRDISLEEAYFIICDYIAVGSAN